MTEEGNAILVDFGIAKVVDPSQATTAGASGYTPGYAAPEQYGGTIRTGPYTDQYSLAALVYHLLTGEKPADAIERALGKCELTPLDRLAPGVPPDLQAAVERALSLRPSDRFADIDDFLQAIDMPRRPPPRSHRSMMKKPSSAIPPKRRHPKPGFRLPRRS